MSAGLVAAVLVAAGVGAAVAWPLLRHERERQPVGPAGAGEWRELQSRHEMLLASLRDLEDDRATGKLGDDDYREMHARLSAQAVEVIKQLDAFAAAEEGRTRPIPHPHARPTDQG